MEQHTVNIDGIDTTLKARDAMTRVYCPALYPS